MKPKTILLTGSIFAFLGVSVGAFAAHGLKLKGYEASIFDTAVKYQFYHSLALLFLGLFALQKPNVVPNSVPILFTIGILFFSGSLYALAITGTKVLGAITPIGGICFLAGWILVAARLIQTKSL